MRHRLLKRHIVLVGAVVVGMLTTSYAFTAANTMPTATRAGDGNVAISGYTVSGVKYNLNALDPSLVDTYEFDLNADARQVKAKLSSAATTYDSCTESLTVNNHWTCTAPTATTVASVNNLRVIATE